MQTLSRRAVIATIAAPAAATGAVSAGASLSTAWALSPPPPPSPDAALLRLGTEWAAARDARSWENAEEAADRVMAVQPATLAGLALWANVMVWRYDPSLRDPGANTVPPTDLAQYGTNEAFAIASAIYRLAAKAGGLS